MQLFDRQRFFTAYSQVDIEQRGYLRFSQVELLLNKMGLFEIAGDARKRGLIISTTHGKQRFMQEVSLYSI